MGAPFKFKTMDNLDNNTCLYLHIKPESKEVFYVGIGTSKRPHKKSGRSRWWRGVVNKYGYEVIILADDLSWKDACEKEIYLIDYYGRRDLGKGTLVNMTDGGEGAKGCKTSKETRAKLSAAKKGRTLSEETRAKIGAFHKGKIVSKETRAKLSAAHTGKKHTEETRAKLSALNKGRKLSAENAAKLIAANKGRIVSKETRAKMSAAKKGRTLSEETRLRMSKASKVKKLTEGQVISILIELRNKPYLGQNLDLAKKYELHINTISSIKHNKSWKCICRETLTIR